MKCRALTKDNHVIWFKREIANFNQISYRFTNFTMRGITGTIDILQNTRPVQFVLDGTTYRLNYMLGPNDAYRWYGNFHDENIPVQKYGTFTLINNTSFSNYVSDTDAVVASLIQRLSVIKGELWYQINYGLPLTESVSSAALFDSVIADIITSHPGVASLDSYKSWITGHTYYYTCKITSIFAESAEISNNFTV